VTRWTDTRRSDRFEFVLIDPMDIESVRGTLDGVKLDGSSVTIGYDTDERISASLAVCGQTGIGDSLVRIVHHVDAWGYSRELGTFFVRSDDSDRSNGVRSGTVELKSAIYGIEDDLLPFHYSIPDGRYTGAATDDLLGRTGRPYRVQPDAYDRRYGSATVYDVGTSVLSILLDICSTGGNRLDVDGHGRLVVARYVNPSAKTPIWAFSDDDSMVCGGISESSSSRTSAGRSIVTGKDGDSEYTAYADARPGSATSSSRRGRMVGVLHSESSVTSQSQAQSLAGSYLSSDSAATVEHSFTTRYVPLQGGDAVTLDMGDGPVKCAVRNVELDLHDMTEKITAKEV